MTETRDRGRPVTVICYGPFKGRLPHGCPEALPHVRVAGYSFKWICTITRSLSVRLVNRSRHIRT